MLSAPEISSIIDEVLRYFAFPSDIEITLEANPDDLSKEYLHSMRKTPVNRLSIGTQSFFEDDLKLMNRAHNAQQAEDSIKRAQDFGFENINIDLIYGSPCSRFEVWQENLRKAISLNIPHISSYAMTVEPQTALQHWIQQNRVAQPDETLQSREFEYMTQVLKQNGFQHYEISNFAKPGRFSRHNAAYWQGKEYLGIGPSAHSFDGKNTRSWNIANNKVYADSVTSGVLPLESEILTEKERYNELIMIGLRTARGVDLNAMTAFDGQIQNYFRIQMHEKLQTGEVVISENFLKIPEEKWFFADGIAADLFLV